MSRFDAACECTTSREVIEQAEKLVRQLLGEKDPPCLARITAILSMGFALGQMIAAKAFNPDAATTLHRQAASLLISEVMQLDSISTDIVIDLQGRLVKDAD